MRLFACFLLIASLLLQRAALPHSHTGTGVTEPEGHDARPHIHLGHEHHGEHAAGHVHHRHDALDHDHDVWSDGLVAWHDCPAPDHDHDAVYIDASSTICTVHDALTFQASDALSAPAPSDDGEHRSACRYTWAPPRYGERVPIFLASIRLLV